MDDFTPTTEQVRRSYRSPYDAALDREEFDRWLAQHDAEVQAPFRAVLASMDDLIEHSAVIRSDFNGAADALRKALEQ